MTMMMDPISSEVPDVATVERAIIALMDGGNYLVGPLTPEEVNIGVKANKGLMCVSTKLIGEALTDLVVAGKIRVILAAGVDQELKAYFGRTHSVDARVARS